MTGLFFESTEVGSKGSYGSGPFWSLAKLCSGCSHEQRTIGTLRRATAAPPAVRAEGKGGAISLSPAWGEVGAADQTRARAVLSTEGQRRGWECNGERSEEILPCLI